MSDNTNPDVLKAQRIAALWQKPLLSDAEIAEATGLPFSTWTELKRKGDRPVLFRLGRRVYARTEDVKVWLDGKAKTADYGRQPGGRQPAFGPVENPQPVEAA